MSGRFATPGSRGNYRGNYNSNYGARRNAPQTSVNVNVNRPPPRPASRPSQPQGGQGGYNYSDEDLAEIKRLKIELFNRAAKLALLPGNIPMCYSVGYALITDKKAWENYYKYECKRYAYRLFHIRRNPREGDDAAPFTWGIRPISATKLVSTYGDEAAVWVWDFITSNITPYPDARNFFAQAINDIEPDEEWTAESKAAILDALNPSSESFEEIPSRQAMLELLGLLIHVPCSPPELLAEYESDRPRFANLMHMQNAGALRQRQARISEQLARVSQVQSEVEDDALQVPEAVPRISPVAQQAAPNDFFS